MKKSAKLKRKTRRLIIKNLIVFAVLIAVVSVGVHSWFVQNATADASGIYVECSVPDSLEIAVVAPGESVTNSTEWHDKDFDLNAEDYPFVGGIKLSEITGDGKTFIKPPIKQYSSVAYPDTSADWSDNNIATSPNAEYLSFDVYFRSRSNTSVVQLDAETFCGPDPVINSTGTKPWGDAVNGWKSASVIGAARLSVIDPDASSSWQKLLWIPAPFLHYDPVTYSNDDQLKYNITDTSNTLGLKYKGSGDSLIELHKYNGTIVGDGTYNHGYWINKTTRGKIMYGSNPASNVTATNEYKDFKLHKNVDVFSFPSTTTNYVVNGNTIAYYSGHVRVNLWIEGEDPECRSTQLGGVIKAILNFKLANS